jgi:peptidylprolyl isomerase
MGKRFSWIGMGLLMVAATFGSASAASPEDTLYLELKDGRVVIEMRPDLAPKHVARIKELVGQKFYDGIAFHRVIDGFMAQTGDPKGDGTGGSGKKLPAEFSDASFVRGTVGLARAASPDSGDSQFFICFAPAPFLNGKYTVWGQVTAGMEYVDRIKRGEERNNGAVSSPDRIVTMRTAAAANP